LRAVSSVLLKAYKAELTALKSFVQSLSTIISQIEEKLSAHATVKSCGKGNADYCNPKLSLMIKTILHVTNVHGFSPSI